MSKAIIYIFGLFFKMKNGIFQKIPTKKKDLKYILLL